MGKLFTPICLYHRAV